MSGKNETGTRFGRKLQAAVAAVLSCPTLAEASQLVQIPESTLRRWRQREEFVHALRAAQEEFLLSVGNELRQAGLIAASTLRKVAQDANAPTPSRVRACGLILSLLLRSHEREALEARMALIEAKLKRRSK